MLRQGTFKDGTVTFPTNSSQVLVSVDEEGNIIPGGGGTEPASEVSVTNFPASQAVTGPITDTQIKTLVGTVSVAAWSGTGDATMIAILKAIYAQNAVMITHLETIATNTTPAAG